MLLAVNFIVHCIFACVEKQEEIILIRKYNTDAGTVHSDKICVSSSNLAKCQSTLPSPTIINLAASLQPLGNNGKVKC